MPVDDYSTIDFVAIKADTGEVSLVIADQLEWDPNNEHLVILQNKINVYLEGIEDGSLCEAYPEAKNRRIVIEVMAKHHPSETGKRFLKKMEADLNAAGYGFSFTVLEN